MMPGKLPTFGLRMSAETKKWIKQRAAKNKRSINSEINLILISEQKKQEQHCDYK